MEEVRVVTCRRTQPSFHRRSLLVLDLMLSLLLAACTYGPPRERVWIEAAMRRPDTRQFVVLVRHDVVRGPTGLSKFPIGDRSKLDRQWVTFYSVDIDSRSLFRVGAIPAPNAVWTSFDAHFGGWNADTVYVELSGCSRGGECWGSLQHNLAIRFGPRGPIEQVETKPAGVHAPPDRIAPAPGESLFLRLRVYPDSIQLQTEYPNPHVTRFVLDGRGELVSRGL